MYIHKNDERCTIIIIYATSNLINCPIHLKVPASSRNQVDGLCGFFDGEKDNDRQKPNGRQARTNAEFGDSWGTNDCETRVCPIHVQNLAWQQCNTIK